MGEEVRWGWGHLQGIAYPDSVNLLWMISEAFPGWFRDVHGANVRAELYTEVGPRPSIPTNRTVSPKP